MVADILPLSGIGRVSIETAIVSKIASWSASMTMDTEESTSFENTFKMHDTVRGGWTVEMSGFAPVNDEVGQEIIKAAAIAGTMIIGLRFYTKYSETVDDEVKYWMPDTTAEPGAGIFITSFSINKDDGSKLTKVSFSGLVSGPLKEVTETIVV